MPEYVSGNLDNYKDFADNDYLYFVNSCKAGLFANSMGANAQNIAERYLKYIVDEFAIPETEDEENRKRSVLRTHSLNVLLNYIMRDLCIDFPITLKNNLLILNSLYFSTKSPGDDTIRLTVEDILQYKDILTDCKNYVEKLETEIGKSTGNGELSDDPFYSEENMLELKKRILNIDLGKSILKEHALIDYDE